MDLGSYGAVDATDLAALVRAGEVTVDAVVAAARAAHEATHGTINAVVEWYDDPTVPPGPPKGPLAGVPVLRKDYGSAEAGRLVEMGSRLAVGARATSTAPLIARLQAAGAVIVGRSAVPEFIQHGTTESELFGATRNPHNPSISAGGSSGGSAAAVAAGVVPLATASDCAGSIRIPASVCGLVGLKPSPAMMPWPGGGWGGIASEFVVTRTVRDSDLLLDVLADRLPPARPGSLRIACSVDHWAGAAPESAVVDATVAVAHRLDDAGHDVSMVEPPLDYDQLMRTWHPLFSRWVVHDAHLAAARSGRALGPDTIEPVTAALVEIVDGLTAEDLTNAQLVQAEVAARLASSLSPYDLLLTPSLGRAEIPLGRLAGGRTDLAGYLADNDEVFPYHYLFNVTGWAAVSLPAGAAAGGVPLGVQLAGRPGAERTLLRIGAELERATS